jgi:polyisoprenoid-binding protein YceI
MPPLLSAAALMVASAALVPAQNAMPPAGTRSTASAKQPQQNFPDSLIVDPTASEVRFSVATTLHTVHGTIRLHPATIRFNPAGGAMAGEIIADSDSAASGNSGLDTRMKQQVLDSSRYPEIWFRPEWMKGAFMPGGSSIQLTGTLEIHGGAHQLTLAVHVVADRGRFTAETAFVVPYVDWGMKRPSMFLLRTAKVVNVTVKLSGTVVVGGDSPEGDTP